MPNDLGLRMMARCIELSRDSVAVGELPFGCVICHDKAAAGVPGSEGFSRRLTLLDR